MKSRLFRLASAILLLFSFAAGTRLLASAADKLDSDRAAITKLFNDQVSAWNSGNVEAFVQGY